MSIDYETSIYVVAAFNLTYVSLSNAEWCLCKRKENLNNSAKVAYILNSLSVITEWTVAIAT